MRIAGALALWLLVATSAHAAKPIVAVFDIELRRVRLSKALVEALWETLTTKLTESGAYQVVPKDKLKSRLRKAKRRSFKRCYAKSCQLAIGRELAANKTISARITRVGRTCLFSLKVWDLRKATAEKAAQAKGKCGESALLSAVESAVAKLTGGRRQAPTSGSPAASGRCPSGQVAVHGHCCWPGQDWGAGSRRCIGKPRCPAGFLANGNGCTAGCTVAGQVLVAGHCCWPGQDWGATAKRCIGRPARCPKGLLVSANGCVPRSKAGERWVVMPAGHFNMGSLKGQPDERPIRRVVLKAFAITRSEVTVGQFLKCHEAKACAQPPGRKTGCNYGRPGRAKHPVNCVNRAQARAFCKWIGGRLPSESEWEYAARSAGKSKPFPWGDKKPDCTLAVMKSGGTGCGKGRTWPVCSKSAGRNAQGVCDLAGNVWEWVADCYHPSYSGAPTDGSARRRCSGSLGVFRGGGWFGEPKHLRAADRSWLSHTSKTEFIGFRCAKSL